MLQNTTTKNIFHQLRYISFFLCTLLAVGIALPIQAHASDITITSNNDTTTYEGFRTQDDSAQTWLWVGFGQPSHNEESYVGFSRQQLVQQMTAKNVTDSQITAAKLRLYIIDEDNQLDSSLYTTLQRDHRLTIKPVRGAQWSEKTMNWNTRSNLIWTSSYGEKLYTVRAGTPRKTWVDIDVTDLVKSEANRDQTHYTFWLIDTDWNLQLNRDIAFASKEYQPAGQFAPQLVFSFNDQTGGNNTVPTAPKALTQVLVRTTFIAKPGQEPAPTYGDQKSPWPRIAFYLNNGSGYDGLYDYRSCADAAAQTSSPVKGQASCGTPNRFLQKLVEEFEVNSTSFVKENLISVSDLLFNPYSNQPNLFYTKLSYAYHNDLWLPLQGIDRDVSIAKVEIIDPTTKRIIKTVDPSQTSTYATNGSSTNTNVYMNAGVADFSGLKDNSHDGMMYVFDSERKVAPEIAAKAWILRGDSSLNIIMSDLRALMQCNASSRPGDVDGDSDVDIFDFNRVVTDFGKKGTSCFTQADLDGDGDVDIFDFNIVVSSFGKKY